LLGTSERYEDALPADVRQRNFTVNQAQTVSSDWNAAVETLAKQTAAKAVTDGALSQLSPCSDDNDSCAGQFIDSFASKAFRRPASEAERAGLLGVYQQGAVEGAFSRGAELVIATVLQAPSFLYLTELGDGAANVTTLTGDEIASMLAYVTTKSPPDAQLVEAGRSGALADAAVRAQHARRLLGTEAGKTALGDFIVEWFTSDWVLNASKDNIPAFNQQRAGLYAESRDLVRAVIDNHQADFTTLLTADFTVVTPEVASYYGMGGSGQVSLTGTPRLGIATGAAFLGGHSSPTHSSPVKRGAAFMRQVLCTDPPDPSTVNLVVAAPPPDPTKSTRQLFAAHSEDPTCQACHQLIDPIGFAFEEFDEGGLVRQGPEDNNGYPVDASGTVTIGAQTFTWSNAAEFLQQVADSDLARRCVARTATRFGFAWANSATELKFVEQWNAMESDQQTQIGEVLVKLVESDLFVQRKAQ
jgi:mono/diheme cytochrome c family protein